jgi:hypothetical protein
LDLSWDNSQLNNRFQKSLEEGHFWRRINVNIVIKHGINNDANIDDAELCKACATKMLKIALMGVKNGVDGNYYPLDDNGQTTSQDIFAVYKYNPKTDK